MEQGELGRQEHPSNVTSSGGGMTDARAFMAKLRAAKMVDVGVASTQPKELSDADFEAMIAQAVLEVSQPDEASSPEGVSQPEKSRHAPTARPVSVKSIQRQRRANLLAQMRAIREKHETQAAGGGGCLWVETESGNSEMRVAMTNDKEEKIRSTHMDDTMMATTALEAWRKKRQDSALKEQEALQTQEPPRLYVSAIRDAATHVAPDSVDLILTDPPYIRTERSVYAELGRFAQHALKEGGLLAVMGGDMYMPEVLSSVCSGGPYFHFPFVYLIPQRGGEIGILRVTQRKKMVLVYVKGRYSGKHIGADVVEAPPDAGDRNFHPQGQSVGGMQAMIELLTERGQTVCDPFCGGGATGLAAAKKCRKFIGMDIDEKWIAVTEKRIAMDGLMCRASQS